MGCLNSSSSFGHWFGNIHLSGPCNRKCYFCIGQHMMALDAENTLGAWPLPGFETFLAECDKHPVKEICLTGTNTDPMLYKQHARLTRALRQWNPGIDLAIRTNAVRYNPYVYEMYDKASITLCSTDYTIYHAMMGAGVPPDVARILRAHPSVDFKVNVVLGPENAINGDIFRTLDYLQDIGVPRVNLREPYGQPHVGNPLAEYEDWEVDGILGMPRYDYKLSTMLVTYWDVHYVEVESVNLYASGRVSLTYPITKGHAESGVVLDQTHFPGGRVREQWVSP